MPASPTPALAESPARERILLTAHDLFYREGIRATGVDRVIAEAGVTKVTFYRHFPSKNDLVLAFLAFRHTRWMAWFTDALARHGRRRQSALAALVPALDEWFGDPGYRGCAFLNSVGEMGTALPEVVTIAREHKRDMTAAIAGLLPHRVGADAAAGLLTLAVDGAILHAQFDTPAAALAPLRRLVRLIEARGADT